MIKNMTRDARSKLSSLMNSKNDFGAITAVKLYLFNSTVKTHEPQLNQSSFFKCEQTDNKYRALHSAREYPVQLMPTHWVNSNLISQRHVCKVS